MRFDLKCRAESMIVGAMSRSLLNLLLPLCALSACVTQGTTPVATPAKGKPNIIFILADDLGYGELGVYGQKLIATPRLDEMAGQGLRFSQFYAGNTVCAPSRAVLMTGKHMGHVSVRGNASKTIQHLNPEDTTVAQVLKGAGYRTALIGNWGLVRKVRVRCPTRRALISSMAT